MKIICYCPKNIRASRNLLHLLIFVLVMFCESTAYAATITCDTPGAPNFAPAVGAVSFPRDSPIGSASQPYPATFNFHCQGDPNADRDIYMTFSATPATRVAGYSDVYPTNIAGVGIRYTISNGAGTACRSLPLTVSNGSIQFICHQAQVAQSPGYNYSVTISAQLIKTANIVSGALTTIPSLSVTNAINNQAGSFGWGNVFSGAASGTLSAPACSVTMAAFQIDMPQANIRNLPSIGSTTGATPLNLALDCNAGVKVAVTLSDITTPSNRSSTLSLTADSTAKGVGYQISYAGMPISYGPDSSVAGNTNQIMVSSVPTTGGAVSVPLRVNYIRTGAVTPGTANAKATFTMSYQ